MRKLFKGGNYSRAEPIRGNTVSLFKKGFGPVVVHHHALSAHYRAIDSQMQKAKVICSNSMMNVTSKDMTSKAQYCVCAWVHNFRYLTTKGGHHYFW